MPNSAVRSALVAETFDLTQCADMNDQVAIALVAALVTITLALVRVARLPP